MLEKTEKELLEKGWKSVRIISAAIFITPVIYYFISTIIGSPDSNAKNNGLPPETLKFVFLGLSISALFAAFYLRKITLNVKRYYSIAEFLKNNETLNMHPAISKYITAVILSLAISETIAIFGLIILIISNDRFGFYQLLVISAIAMICFRPKKIELLELAEKMKQNQIKDE